MIPAARLSAWSRSAMMSSMCSMPMLSRIISGVTPALRLLLGGHLPMGGRGRMAGQRLRIAEIDQTLDQLERIVEFCRGSIAAAHAEGHQRAGAAAKIFLRERVIGVVRKAGVVDPLDRWIAAQELGDSACRFRRGDRCAAPRSRFPAAAETRSAETARSPSCADRRCGSARCRRPRRNARCRRGRDRTRRARLNIGKRRACCFQGNLPLSTMMPPSVVPWPPMNFVSEWTTMSAPYSIGRSRIGVATVLSTISGMPWLWATLASASMSQMLPAGLPTLSQKNARVLSSISFSIAAGWSLSAKRTVTPELGQHVREQRVGGAVELRDGDDIGAELGDVEHGVVQRRLSAG